MNANQGLCPALGKRQVVVAMISVEKYKTVAAFVMLTKEASLICSAQSLTKDPSCVGMTKVPAVFPACSKYGFTIFPTFDSVRQEFKELIVLTSVLTFYIKVL